MKIKVYPNPHLKGYLETPSSKSHSIRAIIFASLASGISTLHNPLISEDVSAMLQAAASLGAHVTHEDKLIKIEGIAGLTPSKECTIDARDSGLVLRFLTALGTLFFEKITLTGTKALCERRSIQALADALEQLGAKVCYHQKRGYAPITVKGPLTKKCAEVIGEDSQPVSALLITLSHLAQTSVLTVKNPGEKPWIDMTLFWLKKIGKKITHQNYERYVIEGNNKPFEAFDYTVPTDFSSLAFPLVAALLCGDNVQFGNIDFEDIQGDKKLLNILESSGAKIERKKESIVASRSLLVNPFYVDMNEIIDAIPILAVVATQIEGESVLYNAAMARHKESDRLSAIATELRKMGADIQEENDKLTIRKSILKSSELFSHNDHRIAMALFVAALKAEAPCTIEGFECVAKTYPLFLKDMTSIGAKVEVFS